MQSNDSDASRRIERIQELSNQLTEAIESAAMQRNLARQLAEEASALADLVAPDRRSRRRPRKG
jgi:hypothetical protein